MLFDFVTRPLAFYLHFFSLLFTPHPSLSLLASIIPFPSAELKLRDEDREPAEEARKQAAGRRRKQHPVTNSIPTVDNVLDELETGNLKCSAPIESNPKYKLVYQGEHRNANTNKAAAQGSGNQQGQARSRRGSRKNAWSMLRSLVVE